MSATKAGKGETLVLAAVGDVLPNKDVVEGPDKPPLFAYTADVLKQADIAFCPLETHFSKRGSVELQRIMPGLRADPENVSTLVEAGFNIVSFASNLTLSWGEEALSDTLNLLKKNDIMVIGAGKNIAGARKPAIIEKKGNRVAFLGYCSVIPRGAQAEIDKPGAAPMRASTFYEQVDWQAGTPPRIITIANAGDLQAMKEDIAKVKQKADIVVVSIHWGVHYMPSVIAMYQKEVGHAAIDAGADLILGHHAHILKGIEVYKGKIIFYGLGNFAMQEEHARVWLKPEHGRLEMRTLWGWKEVDMDYPNYPFPADSRKTILVKCSISSKQIQRVAFLPVMVNKKSQPEILYHQDSRSGEVTNYIKWLCEDQEFGTKFVREKDEVVIVN